MPFKSKAQRRKFYALKAQGKMSQDMIDEWESSTPKKIPERLEKKAFWLGFYKQAEFGDGGGGFSGTGKGSLGSGNEGRDTAQGLASQMGPGKDETMVDRSMRDRVRGPKDWSLTSMGEELADETNPHLIT